MQSLRDLVYEKYQKDIRPKYFGLPMEAAMPNVVLDTVLLVLDETINKMQSLAGVRYDLNEYTGGHKECDENDGVRIPYTLIHDIADLLWKYYELKGGE